MPVLGSYLRYSSSAGWMGAGRERVALRLTYRELVVEGAIAQERQVTQTVDEVEFDPVLIQSPVRRMWYFACCYPRSMDVG